MPELTASGEISKVDDDKRLVFGWAYVASEDGGMTQVVDKSGDLVQLESIWELEKAAYEFVIKSREGGDWHQRKGVSTMVESIVFTPEKIQAMNLPPSTPVGWWVGFRVTDDDVWKSVKSGAYRSFSIHGSGVRKEVPD